MDDGDGKRRICKRTRYIIFVTISCSTSISSKLSCCEIQRRTFFLLLSCISPANSNSSRMK
ncbi:hypothetical protein I7I48_04463 [Histoplasma ohiense]|nr:hypothetical protein I7I48_04463 [Histoplasma ohiense (nom. inval.)]